MIHDDTSYRARWPDSRLLTPAQVASLVRLPDTDGSFYSAGNVCNSFGGTQYGSAFPAGLVFGVSVRDDLNIALNLDLPLFVSFGDYGTLTVPVLFGGGVEYFLERSTAVTFNFRTGPMIFTKSG